MIMLDLTPDEEADFRSALLDIRATQLGSLRDKQRNMIAYGDRPWADSIRAELPVAERRMAVLDKVVNQLGPREGPYAPQTISARLDREEAGRN